MDASLIDSAALYKKFCLGNYPDCDVTLTRGEGSWVWDDNGKKYLDFTSGIAVNTLGHNHPHWVERIHQQAAALAHCSNLFRNQNQGALAEKLVQRAGAGAGKVFFCNSGAEANETLIKLARLYGKACTGKAAAKYKVVTAADAFHGRTFGGMAATPQEKVQAEFRPMLEGFTVGEFNNLQSFADQVDDQTAAIMIETVQGESGIHPCTREGRARHHLPAATISVPIPLSVNISSRILCGMRASTKCTR